MLLIQLTGLSGSGKSTIADGVKKALSPLGYPVEVLDGDVCRRELWKDLSFSRDDRMENIRRLGFIGNLLSRNGIITVISAINPYQKVRSDLACQYTNVKPAWINCDLATLFERDTKGLYARALLPADHPEKLHHFTGVSDPYEEAESINKLAAFIENSLNP